MIFPLETSVTFLGVRPENFSVFLLTFHVRQFVAFDHSNVKHN